MSNLNDYFDDVEALVQEAYDPARSDLKLLLSTDFSMMLQELTPPVSPPARDLFQEATTTTAAKQSKRWTPLLPKPLNALKPMTKKRMIAPAITPLQIPSQFETDILEILSAPLISPSAEMMDASYAPTSAFLDHPPMSASAMLSQSTQQLSLLSAGPLTATSTKLKCVCGLSFDDMSLLFLHSAKQCVAKSHMCQDCQRGFTRRQDLKRHKLIHTAPKTPISCKDCGTIFSRPDSLSKHKKTCAPRSAA